MSISFNTSSILVLIHLHLQVLSLALLFNGHVSLSRDHCNNGYVSVALPVQAYGLASVQFKANPLWHVAHMIRAPPEAEASQIVAG
mmetsp:Transcript_17183/g.21171  ORF Transcript_17183/g.21171 Transcript_17183/m.21171 type:complete len:86 (-) Transcript_17183:18-275(-)